MLALLLALGLMGCAGEENTETGSAPAEAGYTVTVVDQNGSPVANVMVQLCSEDVCYVDSTDEDGCARFDAPEGSYKANLLGALPQGYDYADEAREFYFPDGETRLSVVLSKTE